MNVFLWVLQVLLALLAVSGGAFKAFKFDQVAGEPWYGSIPRPGWTALGVFEMACGVLLILPYATNWAPVLTPMASGALAIESLLLAGLYGSHSTKPEASNPLVWAVVTALVAAFVACGRFSDLAHFHA